MEEKVTTSEKAENTNQEARMQDPKKEDNQKSAQNEKQNMVDLNQNEKKESKEEKQNTVRFKSKRKKRKQRRKAKYS